MALKVASPSLFSGAVSLTIAVNAMGKLVDEARMASSDGETNVEANFSSRSVYLYDGKGKRADFLT